MIKAEQTEKKPAETMPNIIGGPDGKPFKTQQDALQYRKESGFDQDQYMLGEWQGGFVLIKTLTITQAPRPAGPVEGNIPTDNIDSDKFYWVRFGARRGNEDTELIMFDCSGLRLTMEREQTIAIPGSIVLLARNAKIQKFVKKPGMPRQEIGWIERYPISVLGEATKADYVRSKRPTPSH